MQHGYRIRRTCWEPEEYLYEVGDMLEKREVHECAVAKDGKFENIRYLDHCHIMPLGLKDLLADDWEIVTEGIRKNFNKHGSLEYIDEPDWDNYEPKGWGDEEDE